MVFLDDFFSNVHPRRPSLQEGGYWDFLKMQLGPTSHGHVPNGEKKGSTKKIQQNKLGSHIFPKYLCSPPRGNHIGKLQGLKIFRSCIMDEWSFHFSFFHFSSLYFHPLYNFNFSSNQIFILYIMPPSSIIIQLFVQPYKIFCAFHIF
jgi:hypothetical protein